MYVGAEEKRRQDGDCEAGEENGEEEEIVIAIVETASRQPEDGEAPRAPPP